MQHKYLNKTTKGNLKKKEGILLLDLDKTQNKLTNYFETKINFKNQQSFSCMTQSLVYFLLKFAG